MEVGTINLTLPTHNTNSNDPGSSIEHSKVDQSNNIRPRLNFERSLMGPDEVKSLIYMIIGANGIHVISNAGNTGSNVNSVI